MPVTDPLPMAIEAEALLAPDDHPLKDVQFWETKRQITHAEARESATRLINSHFRNEDRARVSIPANPDRDDDLIIQSYIRQQARAACSGSLIHHSALAEDTARAVEGWQPIETAPKDGRPIWAYLYNSGVRLVRWWSCEDFAAKYGGEPDAFEPGFYEIDDDSEGWSPKHWMPASSLPAPPALPLTKEATDANR